MKKPTNTDSMYPDEPSELQPYSYIDELAYWFGKILGVFGLICLALWIIK
jgi:hypothetical protein